MTPDRDPPPAAPEQCLLDRTRLKNIEDTVCKVDGKVDKLLSHEGPLANIRERVRVVEEQSTRAHQRLDHHAEVLDKEHDRTTGLAVKVAAISALFTGGIFAALMKVFGG